MLSGTDKVMGFHVLDNGSFLLRRANQIEILSDNKKNILEINFDPRIIKDARITIAELPNQRLAIGYDQGMYSHQPSRMLAIFDCRSGECIAKKQIPPVGNHKENTINSISVLSDNKLLVNSRYVCSIKNSDIIIKEDQQCINFNGATPNQPNEFVPLLDKSGFIYFNNGNELKQDNLPTVKIITNEFKEIAHLQLGSSYNNVKYKSVKICDLKPISLDYFACISQTTERYPLFQANNTQHLRIVRNNLKESHKIDLQEMNVIKLMTLNDGYVAVVGDVLKKYATTYFENTVKVFDLKCKLVNEFVIDNRLYIDATPNGQLITCSTTGEIVLHTVNSTKEELRKKIESVLTESNQLMTKDLVRIVSEYAGLFKPKLEMFKNKFAEVDHTFDQKPISLIAKLKSKS